MKLAEALVNRSDLTRKIAQLKQRLDRVVKVQEGEEPAEQPEALLRELEIAVNEQTILIRAINRTNSSVAFNEKWSIADALAERDKMLQLRKLLAICLSKHRSLRIGTAALRFVSRERWMSPRFRSRLMSCLSLIGSWILKFRRKTGR